jgi:hypothetical protein
MPYFSPGKTFFAIAIVGKKQIQRDENSYTTLRVILSLKDYPFSITITIGRTSKRILYHEIFIGQVDMD